MREALRAALEDAGIDYVWRGTELGGFRRPREGSRHSALHNDAFRGFADHMETDRFLEGLSWLLESAGEVATAFMCAESDWRRCHRRMIADAVVAAGGRVIHLGGREDEEHVFHPDARVEEGRLVYDGDGQATLV